MTMTLQMGLVEKILLRIAGFCVDHVIKLRRKQTLRELQKQTELGKLRREYVKFPDLQQPGVQNGNAK